MGPSPGARLLAWALRIRIPVPPKGDPTVLAQSTWVHVLHRSSALLFNKEIPMTYDLELARIQDYVSVMLAIEARLAAPTYIYTPRAVYPVTGHVQRKPITPFMVGG